ncbi:MAG: hypothetical protein K2Q22_17965 [Cytophagales bacterium]|nr:hypothetical protein [Cytophagales bacterium]
MINPSENNPNYINTANSPAQKFADFLRQAEYFDQIKVTGIHTLSFKLAADTPAAKELFVKNLGKTTRSRIHGTFSPKEFLFHINLEGLLLSKAVDDFTISLKTVNDYLNFWLIQGNYQLLYSSKVKENIYFGLHVN